MRAPNPIEIVPAPESEFVLPSAAPATPGTPLSVGAAEPGPATAPRSARVAAHRPGTLLVAPEGDRPGATHRQHNEGLRQLGQRWSLLVDSQEQLFGELGAVLQQATESMDAIDSVEALRDQVQARAQQAKAVLNWCAATLQEMRAEAAQAAAGWQRIDVLGLCQDVVHDLALASDRHFMLTGSARTEAVGNPGAVERLLRQAVELVDQRAAAWSTIQITVSDGEEGPSIAVAGLEGARGEPDSGLVADFRAALAESMARCEPDESGPSGAGLVLHLQGA